MKNILLIDKEEGWTSFDVVAYVRKQLTINNKQAGPKSKVRSPRPKVGHAGTLDPFATGLLIVLIGKEATKKQDEFMKLDKEYEAVLELGKVSSTGDTEGKITPYCHSGLDPESSATSKKDSCFHRNDRWEANDKSQFPVRKQIKNILKEFIGQIEQVPPAFSAIKINGKRAYELARKGEKVELKSRKVKIFDIEILDYNFPFLKLKIKCGSGTYIRSLAKDIGGKLGIGAYLTELRRTKIGKYDLKGAKKVSEIEFS